MLSSFEEQITSACLASWNVLKFCFLFLLKWSLQDAHTCPASICLSFLLSNSSIYLVALNMRCQQWPCLYISAVIITGVRVSDYVIKTCQHDYVNGQINVQTAIVCQDESCSMRYRPKSISAWNLHRTDVYQTQPSETAPGKGSYYYNLE